MIPAPAAVWSPSGFPGMDLPERMPGSSMPAAARNVPENPSGGRRPIPNSAATSNGPTPTPPMPTLRKVASSTNLSATDPLPPSQVVALARDALRSALDNESQVAEGSVSGASMKPGVTVDLSRKNIQKIPEEMVNIVKNELERLALSHNQISALPARFSECTSLRYLNIRANNIREFPMSLCDLKSLEILDLGRNQIQALPPDIAKLTSLKVFSVRKNLIRELPVCLADMGSLQVLKFEGNPLVFPPKEALQAQISMPPNDPYARESEVTEIAVTVQVKRYLKQHSQSGRVETELQSVDEKSDAAEAPTPRVHTKRRVSGRFPIKVQGTDLPNTRSPSIQGIPPVPQRSHFRGLSQQNPSTRRSGVMPLTLGNANERLRSNSETIIRSERSESRNRRMGIVSKKGSDLGTLDETEANNRFSHYRGLSHGSAMQGPPIGPTEPPTPTEQYPQRPVYVRRLSVLPERRRESKIFDPVVEAAKGILYSVFQIHPQIQMLMSLTNDGSAKRSSLEIVFYNTNSHVEELEQEISKHFNASVDDDGLPRENESVHRACQTLVSAYGHVCTLLADNIDTFVDNGDPRYIRSLLSSLYASIMELRATLSSVSKEERHSRQPSEAESMHESYTLKPHSQSSTPSAISRPGITRSRNGTLVHNPANLRVATNVPVPVPYANGNSHMDSLASATPRSGESFASAISRDVRSDTSEEDAAFDRIFLSLQRSADIVLRTLPNFNVQLGGGLRNAIQRGAPPGLTKAWKDLIAMCDTFLHQTELIKSRLSLIKLKEPGVRSQPSFWMLCNNFVHSWTDMAYNIMFSINSVALPLDTKTRLKPIQQSMQETSGAIFQSPWRDLFNQPEGVPSHTSYESQGGMQPMSPTQVSITPQSAALGPAMQATVPKTPRNNDSFAAAFHGNVFDRADTLMANPGKSMSRPGMPRKGHSNLSSLSSVSSFSSEGGNGPPSAMSPTTGMGNGTVRLNGGRAAF